MQDDASNKNINIEPADVTRRTDRSRVIVNYVGVKLHTFFVMLKEERGVRVRREILGTRGGGSGSRLGRGFGGGRRGLD